MEKALTQVQLARVIDFSHTGVLNMFDITSSSNNNLFYYITCCMREMKTSN